MKKTQKDLEPPHICIRRNMSRVNLLLWRTLLRTISEVAGVVREVYVAQESGRCVFSSVIGEWLHWWHRQTLHTLRKAVITIDVVTQLTFQEKTICIYKRGCSLNYMWNVWRLQTPRSLHPAMSNLWECHLKTFQTHMTTLIRLKVAMKPYLRNFKWLHARCPHLMLFADTCTTGAGSPQDQHTEGFATRGS